MLNIINFNIRSFNKNSTSFLPVLEKSSPHVLILTETWFTTEYQASIPNYESYHTVRSDRQSGGVSIYIRDGLISRKIPELCYVNCDIEICTVEVSIDKEPIYFIGIYRPHSGTIERFTLEFERILQNPLFRNRRCCSAGDFNHNLLNESMNTQFVNTLQSHHFFPVITKPTRFPANDNHSPSLIDHIWFNSLNIV